jgi:hypothetical protein
MAHLSWSASVLERVDASSVLPPAAPRPILIPCRRMRRQLT